MTVYHRLNTRHLLQVILVFLALQSATASEKIHAPGPSIMVPSCPNDSWVHILSVVSNTSALENTPLPYHIVAPGNCSIKQECKVNVTAKDGLDNSSQVILEYDCLPKKKQHKLCENVSLDAEDVIYLATPKFFNAAEGSDHNSNTQCRCQIVTDNSADIRPLYADPELRFTTPSALTLYAENGRPSNEVKTACVTGTVDFVTSNTSLVWLEIKGQPGLSLRCNENVPESPPTMTGRVCSAPENNTADEADETAGVYIAIAVACMVGVAILTALMAACTLRRRREKVAVSHARQARKPERQPRILSAYENCEITTDDHGTRILTPPEGNREQVKKSEEGDTGSRNREPDRDDPEQDKKGDRMTDISQRASKNEEVRRPCADPGCAAAVSPFESPPITRELVVVFLKKKDAQKRKQDRENPYFFLESDDDSDEHPDSSENVSIYVYTPDDNSTPADVPCRHQDRADRARNEGPRAARKTKAEAPVSATTHSSDVSSLPYSTVKDDVSIAAPRKSGSAADGGASVQKGATVNQYEEVNVKSDEDETATKPKLHADCEPSSPASPRTHFPLVLIPSVHKVKKPVSKDNDDVTVTTNNLVEAANGTFKTKGVLGTENSGDMKEGESVKAGHVADDSSDNKPY